MVKQVYFEREEMTGLICMQVEETKNMMTVQLSTGVSRQIMKEDFVKATRQLWVWQQDTSNTSFSSQLFRLFCKADDDNKQILFKAYPSEMSAYLLWYRSRTQEEFFKWSESLLNNQEG